MRIPKTIIRPLLVIAAGVASVFTASAQQGTVISNESRSFSSYNWYISASAGEQWLLKGSKDGRYFIGKINAGTWLTPWHGLKVNVQWGSKKLGGLNSAMYFSSGVDYTLNMLKVFGVKNSDTPFSFSLSAGPAYNLIEYPRGDHRYTHTVSFNLGLNAGYDFTPHLGIFGEIMSYTMDRFYSEENAPIFTGADWSVGIRYRFSSHSYSTGSEKALRSEIAAMQNQIKDLKAELESGKAPKSNVIIAPESTDAVSSIDIYFDEYSSYITDEQKKKIDAIGQWMNANPGFSVKVIIFGDGKYESDADTKIRNSRADVIRNLLTDTYGIGADRIQVFGSEEAGYKNLSGCNAKIIFSK